MKKGGKLVNWNGKSSQAEEDTEGLHKVIGNGTTCEKISIFSMPCINNKGRSERGQNLGGRRQFT